MPEGTVVVRIEFMATVVPFLSGMKLFTDQVGMFMSPGNGTPVDGGSAMMSYAGLLALWSPRRKSATVLLKASLRATVKFGPVIGVIVVVGTVIAVGGEIEKSGICITVPL